MGRAQASSGYSQVGTGGRGLGRGMPQPTGRFTSGRKFRSIRQKKKYVGAGLCLSFSLALADSTSAASTIFSISDVEIHTSPFNATRVPFFRSTRAPKALCAFSFS